MIDYDPLHTFAKDAGQGKQSKIIEMCCSGLLEDRNDIGEFSYFGNKMFMQ